MFLKIKYLNIQFNFLLIFPFYWEGGTTSHSPFCHLYFSQPNEVLVTSSFGVQIGTKELFTLSVSVRCLLSSSQGGILSIRVIYEKLYWAYYAWTKTGSFLPCTKGLLCVDNVKKNWKHWNSIKINHDCHQSTIAYAPLVLLKSVYSTIFSSFSVILHKQEQELTKNILNTTILTIFFPVLKRWTLLISPQSF